MFAGELRAAGIRRPHLVRAYRACQRNLAGRNPAAYPVTRALLPPERRPHYDAMLAFFRCADDILDDITRSAGARTARFRLFRERLDQELAGALETTTRSTTEPDAEHALILTAFAHTATTWEMDPTDIRELLTEWHADMETTGYPTFGDFERYMLNVCGVAARWMDRFLGGGSDESVRKTTAWSCGVYLLDILTDIQEDAELGRVYLPLDELERYGVDRVELADAAAQRRMTEPIRKLIAHQTDRIDQLFTSADGWPDLVDRRSRELPRLCLRLGRQDLDRVVRADYDVFRTGPISRLAGLGQALPPTAASYLRSAREHRRRRVPISAS